MKMMFAKFMYVMCLSVFTISAHSLEVKGVKVDESVQVGVNTLVLNGAGVRTKMMFKVYVAALYLGKSKLMQIR